MWVPGQLVDKENLEIVVGKQLRRSQRVKRLSTKLKYYICNTVWYLSKPPSPILLRLPLPLWQTEVRTVSLYKLCDM